MRILLFLFNWSIIIAQTAVTQPQPTQQMVPMNNTFFWGQIVALVGILATIIIAVFNNLGGRKNREVQMKIHDILTKFKDDMSDEYKESRKEGKAEIKDLVDRFEIYKTNITDKWDSLKTDIIKEQSQTSANFDNIIKALDDLPDKMEDKMVKLLSLVKDEFNEYSSDMNTSHVLVHTENEKFILSLNQSLTEFTLSLEKEVALRMNEANDQNDKIIGNINSLIESVENLKEYNQLILRGGKDDLATFFINEGSGSYVRKFKPEEK